MTIKFALTAALVAVAGVSQQPAEVDVTRLGPQVGARVVDFSLKDHRGQTEHSFGGRSEGHNGGVLSVG